MPAHFRTDKQILRLTYQRADTAQSGSYCAMHHQVTKEGPKLQKLFTIFFPDRIVAAQVMIACQGLAGSKAMIDIVESVRHRDNDGGDGQSVKEG